MNEKLEGFFYPLARSRDLRFRPVARTLQGKPLVLFRDGSGAPAALVDRCPHRNVPLSLGKREADGTIACAYHGWRFAADGGCRLVPGLLSPGEAAARRAVSHAAVEEGGLVWVYSTPETTPDSRPFHFPYLDDPAYTTLRHVRTLEGTVAAAVENALDVPHTAFLHAGLFRTKKRRHEVLVRVRRSPEFVEATYTGEPAPRGLLGRILAPGGGAVHHVDRFFLPSITQVEYRLGEAAHLMVTTAFTPADEGFTRLYTSVSFRIAFPGFIVRPLVGPLALHVLDQDARILSAQEKNLRRFGGEKFANTPLDVLGPHVSYLIRRAACGEPREPVEVEPRRVMV